jgi:hypothetical protein
MNTKLASVLSIVAIVINGRSAIASGHGPVFGAATPTLGRGGWSVDQAWTLRAGDEDERQHMLRTMLSFGVTENLQVSGSFPLAMNDGRLAPARMMSAMSSDRELEGLVAYRFQRRPIGIGGRQESTLYLGGTAPLESTRGGVGVGPSFEAGASTGYASRAHYVWVGGGVQDFFERGGDQFSQSRLLTVVYGYRPPVLRTEAGKPDFGSSSRQPSKIEAPPGYPASVCRQCDTIFIQPASSSTKPSDSRQACSSRPIRPCLTGRSGSASDSCQLQYFSG